MSGSLISARGLVKRFGAVTAADNVSAEIRAQETVGIIGSNGAGKTTFVNMVTGYMKPDDGSIHFRGRDITRFLEAAPGWLAKDGADGVFAAAGPDGTSVALKISDGAALCTITWEFFPANGMAPFSWSNVYGYRRKDGAEGFEFAIADNQVTAFLARVPDFYSA